MLEIAVGLKNNGHDVTVTTMLKDAMVNPAKKHNIKLHPMQEPPGYKLGDGKWMVNGPQGPTPSIEKTLYKVQDVKFDVLHVFNDELIDHYLRLYPDNSIVNTQYVDGLFVMDTKNEKVGATINLRTNLDLITNEFIDNLLTQYKEVL
jgi:hypothetical protein